MKGIAAFIKLARLENALLPMVALLAGFAVVGGTDYPKLALTGLVLVILHSVITVWNDIADESGDRQNGITRIGDLKRSGAYNALLWAIAISLLCALGLTLFLPAAEKFLTAGILLLGWAYNSRPARTSRRPVLSIVTLGLAYGLAPFLMGTGLGRPGRPAIILAIGWTIGRASLSLLKDYKDAPGDAVADKRTFLLVYGGRLTARLSFGLGLAGYLICVSVAAAETRNGLTAALILSAAGLWLVYERSRLFKARRYDKLNAIFHDCVKYQLVFDGLVVACLRIL